MVMAGPGVASASGTERFRQRFASCDPSHFRPLQELWAPSIGLGTYLGEADDATDALYADAIRAALTSGCNLLDTAVNYRCQRSERVIGRTVAALCREGLIARDEVLLCTKGGYLAFDGAVAADPGRYLADTVIDAGLAPYEEIVGGCHCLSPAYLEAALSRSLVNLRVQTIDLYYLHNPEQQLEEVGRDTLFGRLTAAFTWLEQCVRDGRIRYYGLATWNGLRVSPTSKSYLALEAVMELAERAGGRDHHCRAVQLPYNLALPEAYVFKNQTVAGELLTPLQAAQRLGVSVVVSASLLQSRLSRLPSAMESLIPGPFSAAQRAVQFARSTPGVTTALVGMKQRAHVDEILALAGLPLLSEEPVSRLFDRARR